MNGMFNMNIWHRVNILFPGIPIAGNFFDLNQKHSNGKPIPLQEILDRWRYQFGSTFKFRIGLLTYVVFGTYESIMESMVQKGKDFANKPRQYRFGHFLIHIQTNVCVGVHITNIISAYMLYSDAYVCSRLPLKIMKKVL